MEHKCTDCRYKGEHQEMMFKPFGVCIKATNLIEAEKAYNADICPYEKEYGSPFGLSVKATQTLAEVFQNVFRAIKKIIPTLQELVNQTVKVCQEIVSFYPNKRVVHLALHAKKKRTRKKNINRILKDMRR